MLRTDCAEVFCRQLSDQLVPCKSCNERPILFNVIKDEGAMRNHVNNHHDWSAARESLYQLLKSTIQSGSLWQFLDDY